MQKAVKKYGVVVLLYLVVISGVLLLSSRLRYLNNKQSVMNSATINSR